MQGTAVKQLLRRAWDRAFYLVSQSIQAFRLSRGPQLSAAISYRFIFSVFPIAIFLVSILGIFLQDAQTRQDVVDAVVGVFSLNAGALPASIARSRAFRRRGAPSAW